MMGISAQKSYAQLSDEEYNYVTMDLRGILNLTMTTNPQVDFTFKTIQEYAHGITQYNAVQLEVDATLAWDLFVYPSTDLWNQVESYSTNGNNGLPSEILEMQSNVACVAPENMANVWKPLLGYTAGGSPINNVIELMDNSILTPDASIADTKDFAVFDYPTQDKGFGDFSNFPLDTSISIDASVPDLSLNKDSMNPVWPCGNGQWHRCFTHCSKVGRG